MHVSSAHASASSLRFSAYPGSHSAQPSLRLHSGAPSGPFSALSDPVSAWEVSSSWLGKYHPPLPRRIADRNSFSVLVGPINHIKHLLSRERLPFSAVYFSSLGLTLYLALGVTPISVLFLI